MLCLASKSEHISNKNPKCLCRITTYGMKLLAFWCQIWCQETLLDMTSYGQQCITSMPCLAVLCDSSGVKKVVPVLYLKPQMPKLCKWLQCKNASAFWSQTWLQKNYARHGVGLSQWWTIDAMSGIVFWRHVWRQKANKLWPCNQLHNFGILAFICGFITSYLVGLQLHPSFPKLWDYFSVYQLFSIVVNKSI